MTTMVNLERITEILRNQGVSESVLKTLEKAKPELPEDPIRIMDACRQYGIEKVTLWRWHKAGLIRTYQISHKERYVSEGELRNLLEKRGFRNSE